MTILIRAGLLLITALLSAEKASAQFPYLLARAYAGFSTPYNLRFADAFGSDLGGSIGMRLNPHVALLGSFSVIRVGLDKASLSGDYQDMWEPPVDVQSSGDNSGRIITISADVLYRLEDEEGAVSWDVTGGIAYFTTLEYRIDIASVRGSRRLDDSSGSSVGMVAGLGFDWRVLDNALGVFGEGRFGAGVIGNTGFTPCYFAWRAGLEIKFR